MTITINRATTLTIYDCYMCGYPIALTEDHERRGHWRTTRAGKRIWIRNCVVGDASRGSVFHDYKVTAES